MSNIQSDIEFLTALADAAGEEQQDYIEQRLRTLAQRLTQLQGIVSKALAAAIPAYHCGNPECGACNANPEGAA